ncbi:MAG TPA: PEP-CTERM sorting domain-containing protein [Gemmataceae bacterium]|nr:PEP-CTERM sorting domain-containing protein [Gemmataceae bacterium]
MLPASLVLALCLFGAESAKADFLEYRNGSLNGDASVAEPRDIAGGYITTDSFTLTSGASLTQFTGGFWVDIGATPSSIQWSIGTTSFGNDIASGAASGASLQNTLKISNNGFGADVYESTFALSGSLSAGTYWLTLTGTASDAGEIAWDGAKPPPALTSSAFQFDPTAMPPGSSAVNSEFFEVFGNPSGSPVAPEPSSFLLFGVGAVGLIGYVGLRRRKKIAPAA